MLGDQCISLTNQGKTTTGFQCVYKFLQFSFVCAEISRMYEDWQKLAEVEMYLENRPVEASHTIRVVCTRAFIV